jgi:hypothetical protein
MIYGGHKAMMELAVSMMHQRGDDRGRDCAPAGYPCPAQGAFGDEVRVHERFVPRVEAQGEAFVCPVSEGATIWAQSVKRCADNLRACNQHAMPRCCHRRVL